MRIMRFKPSKIFIFSSFLILSLLVVALNYYKLLDQPKAFLNSAFSPVLKPAWKISGQFANIFSFASNLKNIYSENIKLKDSNQKLLSENSYLKDTMREQGFLNDARDLQMKENFDWQASKIIGMDLQNMTGHLIIDSGSADGVEVNMPVITENKYLIGKVVEVDNNFSKVITIFNPSIKVAVKTGDSEAFGLLSGNYTQKLIINMIPKDKELKIGEVVTTSGKDAVYPDGLLIGQVESFDIRPENLFQSASIHGDLNIYDLSRALVITKW